MDYKLTPYVSKVFKADILSYLNVDSEGDVVSAQVWRELWGNILNFTQQIDIHLSELLGDEGILTKLVEDHNEFVEDHAKILADYDTLKNKFASLDTAIAQTRIFVKNAMDAADDAAGAAAVLSRSFIHYGTTPPANGYTRLWVQQVNPVFNVASVANVNYVINQTNTAFTDCYNSIDEVLDYSISLSNQIANIAIDLDTNYYTKDEVDKELIDRVPVIRFYEDGTYPKVYAQKMYQGTDEDTTYLYDCDRPDGYMMHQSNGGAMLDNYSEFTKRIAIRHSNGNLLSGKPVGLNEVANKKYVDDAVANAGGGGNVDLTDYVKNTDYATSNKGGVVKVSSNMGLTMDNNVLAIAPANNSVIDNKNNYRQPIVPAYLDYAVKVGLTTNTNTLTDEEKAAACEWLGAVGIQTPEFDSGATRGYVYFIDPSQNQIVKKVQVQANGDTIPLRNPNGNFYVGTPTLAYECTNKSYVDGLVGDIETLLGGI